MPLSPAQESALKKFLAERQAYDNTEGMMLRSGSIAQDLAGREGVSSIDDAMRRNAEGGPLRSSSPQELSVINQAKQGLDQGNFVRAARGGLLDAPPEPQQTPAAPYRRTMDYQYEANNIPPKMGGGIGNLLSNIFGGGSAQPGQSAPQAPQPQAPQAPPQQGGQNWAQLLLEGFGAGAQGMSVPQLHMAQAQAKLQQFEVQDKMRTQAAQQNFPQFQQKMKAFKPFWKQYVDQKKLENPNFAPNTQTFVEATEAWDEQFPEMAISQTDQDTFNRTAQGTQTLLGMGLLPLNDMLEVKKMGLQEDAKQKAAFRASLMQMPGNPQDVDYQRQVFEQAMGAGQPQTPQLGQVSGGGEPSRNRTSLPPEQEVKFQQWYKGIAKKAGIDPNPDDPHHQYDYRGAFLAGATPTPDPTDGNRLHWPSEFKDDDHPTRFKNGVDTRTGQAIGQSQQFTPFQQMAQQRGLNLQEEMLKETAKQRAKAGNIPTMSGVDANAAMRQRMAPLLTDPNTLNFYGDDQQVSLEQMNKDAEELGKNLRESRKAESREGMQAERLAAKSSEAEKTRTAAASLATMKMENLNANSEKGRDLKMRLAVMDDKFKEAQQKRTFTQQQLQDQFKAEASLNKQREMLQTKAGIAFTLEGMKSDPDQAIKFALEAERAGNATARGLIGDVLETNPALAWPILERLGTLSKENGLSANSVTAVKGAIEDYMKRKSTFSMEEMAQDIVNGPGTDKDKNTKLAMEMRKAKSSGNKQAEDYYQFLLDSRKSAGQTINVNPPADGVELGKEITKEQTRQLIELQNGLGLIGELRTYIDESPIAGIPGMIEKIKNYSYGTAFDLARVQDNVDASTYEKMFNPNIDPGILLANQLRYAVARTREPGGRLNENDVKRVNIGTDITDNTLSLKSTIDALEREMYRNSAEVSERLNQGGMKTRTTPSDRDLVIQNFADDPDLKNYSDTRLRILVQDAFRKGSNTMIGLSELNAIVREIKARRQ